MPRDKKAHKGMKQERDDMKKQDSGNRNMSNPRTANTTMNQTRKPDQPPKKMDDES